MNKQSRDRIIVKFSKTIPRTRFPAFEDAAKAVGNSCPSCDRVGCECLAKDKPPIRMASGVMLRS